MDTHMSLTHRLVCWIPGWIDGRMGAVGGSSLERISGD